MITIADATHIVTVTPKTMREALCAPGVSNTHAANTGDSIDSIVWCIPDSLSMAPNDLLPQYSPLMSGSVAARAL